MTQKQREDHVQAKYWNGFITRTEAQKVFDDYGQAMMRLNMALSQLDAAVSCIAEKVGVTPEQVGEWLKAKAETMKATNGSADKESEVSSLIQA